jgi:hypothetical protein
VSSSSALLAATGDHWPYSGATKLHTSSAEAASFWRSVRIRFVPLRDYVSVTLIAIPQVD